MNNHQGNNFQVIGEYWTTILLLMKNNFGNNSYQFFELNWKCKSKQEMNNNQNNILESADEQYRKNSLSRLFSEADKTTKDRFEHSSKY
jgi:hypothetical protein